MPEISSRGALWLGASAVGVCGVVCPSSRMPIIMAAIAVNKETRAIFLRLLKPNVPQRGVLLPVNKRQWMTSLDISSVELRNLVKKKKGE